MSVDGNLDGPAFYRPKDIAKRWGVSRDVVMARIHSRELPAFKIGPRLYRVPAYVLADYEADRTPQLKTPEEHEEEKRRSNGITFRIRLLRLGEKWRREAEERVEKRRIEALERVAQMIVKHANPE